MFDLQSTSEGGLKAEDWVLTASVAVGE